jgi:hypothetical protein
MTVRKSDLALMLLTASGGLLSAFIAMCLRFAIGHYAVSQNNRLLLNFGQNLVPGAVFGAIISCCFALRGYSRSLWKFAVMTVASTTAYFVAVWVAFGVELYSPFLPPQERGNVSWQALFVSGLVGAFFIILTGSLLLNTGTTGQQRMLKILSWTPAGAFLGILGWALGPSLGMVLWQIVHSMNLTAPTETLRNAHGETSHIFSLWAVWQVGMGCVLGLFAGRKHRMADEPCATQSIVGSW